MTDAEHVPTDQEQAIYQALTTGDQDAIETSREGAQDPEAWQDDYASAHAQYQADHEAPEDEREQNTAKQVQADNQRAAAIEEGMR